MNKSLGSKILILFIALALICGIGSGMTYQKIQGMSQVTSDISDIYLNILKNADNVKINFANMQNYMNQLLTTEDDEARTALVTNITQAEGNIASCLQAITEYSSTDREKQASKVLADDYSAYQAAYDKIRQDIISGGEQDTGQIKESLSTLENNLRIRINTIVFLNSANIIDSQDALTSASNQSKIVFIILLGFLILSVISSILITLFSIIRPTRQASRQLASIVHSIEENRGDLNNQIPVKTKDEIGQLVSGINKFIDVLHEIIFKIKGSAINLQSHVNEVFEGVNTSNTDILDVSAAMRKLSSGMEDVTDNTEHLNTKVDLVSREIDNIALQAKEGSLFAKEMKKRASSLRTEGIRSKENTSQMAEEIQQQLEVSLRNSRDVEKINALTNNILDISSQTELLSLNASIEAARAGEAGKGFAVVAEEIRKLAESSQNTANTIQEISADVTSSVSDLASDAGKMLEFIQKVVLPDYDKLVDTGDQYNSDAGNFDEILQSFSGNAVQLQQTMAQMQELIKEISSTVHESSENLIGVSDSTNQLSDSMAQIQNTISQTEDISRQLESEVARFITVDNQDETMTDTVVNNMEHTDFQSAKDLNE